MNMHTTSLRAAAIAVIGVAAVCASAPVMADSAADRAQAPNAQTRTFHTANREKVLRVAMATLQDHGFVIEKADSEAGSFTAARIEKYPVRITVTAQVRGERQVVVRADAQYEDTPVEAPKLYHDFFAALDGAMPLASHAAD
jgi:hypothetical protein